MNSEKVNADHKALYDAAIRKLPAGIVNYSSVLAALDDPLSSDADIEHLIKGDPVLAAKVLRLANGAYSGITSEVVSLHNACVLLGSDKIRALLLLSSLGGADPHVREFLDDFYHHSEAVALAAATLARHLQQRKRVDIEEVFSIALLHDIGIALIASMNLEQLRTTCSRAVKEKIPYHLAEISPWVHTEAGQYLAQSWHFPQRLVEVIAHHHFDKSASLGIECAIVHVADSMMQFFGYSVKEGIVGQTVNEEALEILEISAEQLRVIAEKALLEQQKISMIVKTIA